MLANVLCSPDSASIFFAISAKLRWMESVEMLLIHRIVLKWARVFSRLQYSIARLVLPYPPMPSRTAILVSASLPCALTTRSIASRVSLRPTNLAGPCPRVGR